MVKSLQPIELDEIKPAHARIAGAAVRTPLVRLPLDEVPAEIYLKLENLQPIGSFKVRGAGNAIRIAPQGALKRGVYTASAGNMAQGVAWMARSLGLDCTAIVPDHAPQTKLDSIARLGAGIRKVPFDEWWQIILDRSYPGEEGFFIHPVSDPAVIAGNGTIGLEILEDLPDVDSVVIPYGGGGLSCGIATVMRALKPDALVYACEVDTASPLAASLAAGSPQEVDYTASFVDGIGASSVLPEIWPLASRLLDGSLVVGLEAVAQAIRTLVERSRVVAEGAGAAPVAAAVAGKAGTGKVVCVVSGGNIDTSKLVKILGMEIP